MPIPLPRIMKGRALGFTADFDRIILINTICCLWFHVFSTVVYVLSLMIMFLNAKHDNEVVLFAVSLILMLTPILRRELEESMKMPLIIEI